MPAATPSGLECTIRSMSNSAAVRSRNSIISRNFQVVSTWSSGNGSLPGKKALRARCRRTDESLPIEYSITGRSNWATTSRMMWTASASNCRRWVRRSSGGSVVAGAVIGRMLRGQGCPNVPAAGEGDLLAAQKAAFQGHLVHVPGPVQPQPVLRDGHIGGPLEQAPSLKRHAARDWPSLQALRRVRPWQAHLRNTSTS